VNDSGILRRSRLRTFGSPNLWFEGCEGGFYRQVKGGFGVPAVEAVNFIPAAWGMIYYLECILRGADLLPLLAYNNK
jgi:hypothetical protein